MIGPNGDLAPNNYPEGIYHGKTFPPQEAAIRRLGPQQRSKDSENKGAPQVSNWTPCMRPQYPNLPGTSHPTRGLFIDRWGTLLDLPEDGLVPRFEDATFTAGAVEALFRAGQEGWRLYLLGNEESVFMGRQPIEQWKAFERDLLEHLRSHGVSIQRNYACTDHPEGVAPHTKDSVFCLPNTGCLYHAAQVDGIALDRSWVVGDSSLELVSGWRAGCRIAGVKTGQALEDGSFPVDPEIMGDTLAMVVEELTCEEFASRR